MAPEIEAQPRSELARQIDEAVEALQKRCSLKPEAGIILGTGLGSLGDSFHQEAVTPVSWPLVTSVDGRWR